MSEKIFKYIVNQYKKKIDDLLLDFLDKAFVENKEREDITAYYSYLKKYSTGGKRLRPILFMMSYKAFGGIDEKSVLQAALSVELLHTSTLVHDDVMDEDDLRRGAPTVHRKVKELYDTKYGEVKYSGKLFNKLSSKFSTTIAILLGNMLYSLGNSALAHTISEKDALRKCIEIFNTSYFKINEGQMSDVLFELSMPSEAEFIRMITLKTALLFMASVEMGAVLAKASEQNISHMKEFAKNAAIAFQLQDDIMDISSDMDKGHEFASDIRQGKKTYLVSKAIELSESDEVSSLIKKRTHTDYEVDKIISIIHSTGAVSYVKELAAGYINNAKSELKDLDINSETQSFFNGLADFMLKRDV